MPTIHRRALVAAGLLASGLVAMWVWRQSPERPVEALEEGEEAPDSVQPRRPLPVFVAGAGDAEAQLAAGEADAATMPEGLVQDLAMFNDDQLRAELQSIALSYPAVEILSVACIRRPCTAEVQSKESGPLDAFLQSASARFQGYLTASFREARSPQGERATRALITMPTPGRNPPPRTPGGP